MSIADFNKDGNQDMAVELSSSSQCVTSILLGNGDGTFTQGAEYQVCGNPLLISDVNGDGNLDIVLVGAADPRGFQSIGVLLGNGDGTFAQPVYTEGPACCGSALGDFNRDGIVDLIAVAGSDYCIFLGKGDGTFQSASCTNLQGENLNFFSLTVGDFNADGKLDLALANQGNPGSIAVLLGNGDGTFQPGQTYLVGGSLDSLAVADFNGDGKLDLAVADNTDSTVLVALGNGDGTFRSPSSFATAFQPFFVATADMNGDGKLDLVVIDYGYNLASVSVLLGNGDGTFQDYADYDGSAEGFLGLADFNNDGRLDVAVPNETIDTVTILTQDNGTVVKLSHDALSFPIQLLDTVSDPKLITLTNTGSSSIAISNISISANFSQLNNCRTVQPGHSCKVAVYFTPTSIGNLIGYLAITDNGGGSPQIVALSGTATIVSIAPDKLDFGSWPVGHVSTRMSVIVTNEGNGSMNISAIGIVGVNKQDFSEVNACPAQLKAGASCTITVIFHPSAKGVRNAILGIEDSGGGSPQQVPLTGTGT
jgi:hypothetical protein